MSAAGLRICDSGEPERRALPDYLPARMVNEYSYCPRLFFYEWVEGVFVESADTVEGKAQHRRVDQEGAGLAPAGEAGGEWRTRSVTLSSERYKLIARLDVVEGSGPAVTPVDYKHGRPREAGGRLEAWPADRVQLGVQALILGENGYQCEEGIVFYEQTRQRVRIPMTQEVLAEALQTAEQAWAAARRGELPPPLADSPKCTGCSLAGVCLPDETNLLLGRVDEDGAGQMSLFAEEPPRKPARSEGGPVRRLMSARSELRPAYLDTQGLHVSKSGDVLVVKEKDAVKQEIRIGDICQLNVMGNIQVTTQAIQALCQEGRPVCYFSQGGWFYGVAMGLSTKNVFLRKTQFRLAGEEWFCLRLGRRLVAGKIRNQRTMILRNHLEPDPGVLEEMKQMAARASQAASLEELLGLEGNAARLYFGSFGGLIKVEEAGGAGVFGLDFQGRNRRPPRDAVNALLSLGYSILAKDLTVTCYSVGFDPMMGYYHQPRFGRPALALDLMEPFRPLIVDSAVVQAINTRMVTGKDFIRAGRGVALKPEGRKAFYRAYEARMDMLVTHPLFDYRVSYRRLLEIQTRLLARWMEGEIGEYPVFVTR